MKYNNSKSEGKNKIMSIKKLSCAEVKGLLKNKPSRSHKYPWSETEVGSGFFVEGKKDSMNPPVSLKRKGYVWKTHKYPNGVLVERVA
tara:strand:+ start:416 stop:679 length:264 start_codon:yes stop_codon:yes gene_type:complete